MKKYFNIGHHYDSITEGWRYIFGDNFHFGYFNTPDDNLNTATNNLIDELMSLSQLGPETKILDAGCGIGTPAGYIHSKFGADITGISVSKKGVDLANIAIAQSGYTDKVRFMVADMIDTKFPQESFDIIWIMESSHLIKNKKMLFDECYRLLKPGGHILLSDILASNKFNLLVKIKNFFQMTSMVLTFGKGKIETSERYAALLSHSDFKKISAINISRQVTPTLKCWSINLIKNKDNLNKVFGEEKIRRFKKSIDALQYFFEEDFFCYYLFTAEK